MLISAARKDPNAAVRIKALESLRDSADDAAVHETLLGILAHDASPGVRIEAVNLLVHSLEQESQSGAGADSGADAKDADAAIAAAARKTAVENSLASTIRALTELQQKDPSRDVRLRSAAALRQIGARSLP